MSKGNGKNTIKNVLDELKQDTEFQYIDESEAMHSKEKTSLPVLALNCILGGGLPLGAVVEGYGVPASGKSSVLYQCMGMFQQNFPSNESSAGGVSVIIDTEASIDKARMDFMGVDSSRVLRLPAKTLEHGFTQILKILDKKEKSDSLKDVPIFILWDTIAVSATDAQVDTHSPHGGGMAEKARLTKNFLSIIMPYVEKSNVLLVLLNQVMSKIGAFRPTTESGGGWGLKHDIHFQMEFKSGKTEFDGIFAIEKLSSINITKSKLSSLFTDIPIIIDITKAGIVDIEKSFVEYMFNIGVLKAGAWSSAPFLLEKYPKESEKFPILQKSFRKEDLINYCRENISLLDLLQVAFIDLISERYSYQKVVCSDYREKLHQNVLDAEKDTSTFNEDSEVDEQALGLDK